MKQRRPADMEPHERDPDHGKLVDELENLREAHGANYARATAGDFARGGKYNQPPRRRYAIT